MYKTNILKLIMTCLGVMVFFSTPNFSRGDIVDLTFTRVGGPTSEAEVVFAFGINNSELEIDQVTGGTGADLQQFNDNIGRDIFLTADGGLDAIGEVMLDDVLDDNFTFPTTSPQATFPNTDGVAYIGFKDSGGRFGFFQVDYLAGGDITYSAGKFNNAVGGALTVSVSAIPEPSGATLVAFAILLTAQTRRRKKSIAGA